MHISESDKENCFEIKILPSENIFKKLEANSFGYDRKLTAHLNEVVRRTQLVNVTTQPVSEIKDLTISGVNDCVRRSLRQFVTVRELAEIGIQKALHYIQTPLIIISPLSEIVIMHKIEPGGRIEYLSNLSNIPPNAKFALKTKY